MRGPIGVHVIVTALPKTRQGEKRWKLRCHAPGGGERCRNVRGTKARALRLARRWEDEINEMGTPPAHERIPPLSEVIRLYLEDCKRRLSRRTVTEYRNILARWLNASGLHQLYQVTPQAAHEWVARRSGEVAAATVNKELRTLRTLWRFARRLEWAEANPWVTVTLPRYVPTEKPVLTVPQTDLLIAACRERSPLLHAAVCLALDTGMRIGEIASLDQRDVDWTNRIIHIRAETTKAKYGRTVPINDWTWAALLAMSNGYPLIFGQSNRERFQKWFRSELRWACRAAGVPEITPHRLRATAATIWAEAGVPQAVLQAVFGWRSPQTAHRFYVRIDAEAAAVNALDLVREKRLKKKPVRDDLQLTEISENDTVHPNTDGRG